MDVQLVQQEKIYSQINHAVLVQLIIMQIQLPHETVFDAIVIAIVAVDPMHLVNNFY